MDQARERKNRRRTRRTVMLRIYMLAAVAAILATDVLDRWSVPIADTDFAVYRSHFISDFDHMAGKLAPKPHVTRELPLSSWVQR